MTKVGIFLCYLSLSPCMLKEEWIPHSSPTAGSIPATGKMETDKHEEKIQVVLDRWPVGLDAGC